jgi:FhaA, N-terminal domain/FHA domain
MNPLRTLETTLTSAVEGAFGRLFRSEVRPMEIARRLAREMDEHRTSSLSRVYAPNEYAVWLSPEDRARYDGVEEELIEELCAYLLEHARSEELTLASQPLIAFRTDDALRLGEFGIQARLVRPPDGDARGGRDDPRGSAGEDDRGAAARGRDDGPPAGEGEGARGETMIYSGSRRIRGPLEQASPAPPPRASLVLDGRRLLVAPSGAVIGRSRDCDVVVEDSGVSRRHASLRLSPDGWTIEDLRSTNGLLLNGAPLHDVRPLRDGDRIGLGTTEIVFESR